MNLRGVGSDAPTSVNEAGGKQSASVYRFDLLPASAVAAVAAVLRHGADKYGADNWRLIAPADHLNHALQHLFAFQAGDTSERSVIEHARHTACRILMWLELLEIAEAGIEEGEKTADEAVKACEPIPVEGVNTFNWTPGVGYEKAPANPVKPEPEPATLQVNVLTDKHFHLYARYRFDADRNLRPAVHFAAWLGVDVDPATAYLAAEYARYVRCSWNEGEVALSFGDWTKRPNATAHIRPTQNRIATDIERALRPDPNSDRVRDGYAVLRNGQVSVGSLETLERSIAAEVDAAVIKAVADTILQIEAQYASGTPALSVAEIEAVFNQIDPQAGGMAGALFAEELQVLTRKDLQLLTAEKVCWLWVNRSLESGNPSSAGFYRQLAGRIRDVRESAWVRCRLQ